MQAFGQNRCPELTEHVAPRPHSGGGPVGELRVIHGEAVMMLGDRHHVTCAGFTKQLRPRARIELLRLEQGNEVLVTEPVLRTVGFTVVRVLRGPLAVHIARIPLIAEPRNRIDSPVNENAEAGFLVPLGHAVLFERQPVGSEGSGRVARGNPLEPLLALAVVLSQGGAPLRITRLRRNVIRCGCHGIGCVGSREFPHQCQFHQHDVIAVGTATATPPHGSRTMRSVSGESRVRAVRCASCSAVRSLGAPISR